MAKGRREANSRFAAAGSQRTGPFATLRITTPNGLMSKQPELEDAAFGVVYGSITVLALLMATHPPIEQPWRLAWVLFLSVFAVAVAKAYAEICERALRSGQPTTWDDVRAVWQHCQTVLIAANGPSIVFALAATGVFSGDMAYVISQILALGLLAFYGAQIGWRVQGGVFGALTGVSVTSAIAVLVSLLKLLAH